MMPSRNIINPPTPRNVPVCEGLIGAGKSFYDPETLFIPDFGSSRRHGIIIGCRGEL